MEEKHRFAERTVSAQTLFEGKIIRLEFLTVELPGGGTSTREVIRHPGAVAVIAEPRPGYLLFVEQYRKAPEQALLEVPAGKLDPGEEPAECALRELAEETGYRAQQVELVYEFFTSPGFADEKIYLYHAQGLQAGERHLDEDEFVSVHELSRDQVVSLLQRGQLRDAKTIIAVQWWLSAGVRR